MRLGDIKPQFILVMGGAGSGKNYYIAHDPVASSYRLIDVDAIKGEMGLDAAIGAIKPMLQGAFTNKENVVHPTTGSHLKGQQNKIALARQNDYKITIVLVDTPVAKAIEHVRKRHRAGGHDVEIDAIVNSNKKARDNFEALKGLADEAIVVGRQAESVCEAPLEPIPLEKRNFYRDIWGHEFNEPGDLKVDNDDDYDQQENPFTNGGGIDHLGTGAEAVVLQHHDQHGVEKIIGTFQELGQNAHLQFLLATKKYASSNPYLPRVLEASMMPRIAGANAKVHGYVVRVERLYPLDRDYYKAGTEEMEVILHKIFGPDFNSHIENDCGFARYIKSGVNGALASQVIDPAFKQAAQLIIAVAKRVKSKYPIDNLIDLHAGNLMLRRTKFGVQLVLSDPLYNGDEWRNEGTNEDINEAPIATIDKATAKKYQEIHADAGAKEEQGKGHGYRYMGNGAEAVVIKAPDHPEVIKIVGNDIALKQNSSLQYALACQKYADSNPFLPRVHSIKKFKNPRPYEGQDLEYVEFEDVKYYYVIHMEELLDLREIETDNGDLLRVLANKTFAGAERRIQSFATDEIADWMCAMVVMIVKHPDSAKSLGITIKDKGLIAASTLIKNIERKTDGYLDIHIDNVMVRIGPHGPQLVITDPLCN